MPFTLVAFKYFLYGGKLGKLSKKFAIAACAALLAGLSAQPASADAKKTLSNAEIEAQL
ncbi:hypothetical protein QMY03_00325 [Arthrobacter sp. KFRI-F3372]|jgi:hypothetical protein|uniref:hypothetical protein n=1 Tax=Pseudarthrobacter oxydans TaxID=1671 RepID=UPI0027982E29|nr:hypothetical protein [Pseudarthrobacter oxydans]WHP59454.1 hypothetical protein QMY03_00325 [Arthrobacter sp. KFRI-F3372]